MHDRAKRKLDRELERIADYYEPVSGKLGYIGGDEHEDDWGDFTSELFVLMFGEPNYESAKDMAEWERFMDALAELDGEMTIADAYRALAARLGVDLRGRLELICKEPGLWESRDDSVMIMLDGTFQTECDGPHPVKMKRDSIGRFSDWYQRSLLSRNRSRDPRYITFQCEGGEEHFYSQWTAQVNGDWTADVYDTFAEAREAVEALVGPTKLVRRKAAV